MASQIPVVDRIRIIPRPTDFLDRNVGSSGEVFFSKETNSLRVYSGKDRSGFEIARADLDNVTDSNLSSRIAALGISGSGTSVDLGSSPPAEPDPGNLWLNTENGRLYIYVNDGDTTQWIQPAVPSFSGDYNDLTNKPIIPTVPTSILDLGISDGTNGQVLSTDGNGNFTFESVTGPEGAYNDSDVETLFGAWDFNLIPATNATYDIGSADNKVRHLYLSDTSLYIGDENNTISTSGTSLLYNGNDIQDWSGIKNKPTEFTDLTLSGITTLNSSTETIVPIDGADNVTEHDYSLGAIFNHTNIGANFTANFTNVPTTNNRTISVVLILNQVVVGKLPIAIQIEGTPQTINWQSGVTPEASTDIDIVSFTLIRANNTWTVIGSLTTYSG